MAALIIFSILLLKQLITKHIQDVFLGGVVWHHFFEKYMCRQLFKSKSICTWDERSTNEVFYLYTELWIKRIAFGWIFDDIERLGDIPRKLAV